MNVSTRRIIAPLSLFVLVVVGVTFVPGQSDPASPSPSSLKYVDCSGKGANHAALKGLLLKATSVKFDRAEKAKVLGTELRFQKFSVVAPVKVQTACINASRAVYGTAVARYSLSVAPDPTDVARRTFLRQIQTYWKAKSHDELRDYKYLPAEKFLWMKSGQYVLYSQPDNELPNATYLLYSSRKVIRLTFEGFQSGDGWGGLSTFLHDHMLVQYPKTQIRCGYTPEISPGQFLARYKNGYFKQPPKP
jgi:hypothetical protein